MCVMQTLDIWMHVFPLELETYIYIYMHLWVLNVYMMDASYSCIHVCNVGIIHMDI